MRIATWNLEGKWSPGHAQVLDSLACDVLLLTECRRDIDLPGYEFTWTASDMQPGRAWAAVGSRIGLITAPDPHPASATAVIRDIRFCSSVLPWGSAGRYLAFPGANITEMTTEALDGVVKARPGVWGGDWNHSLMGREYVGSLRGRAAIIGALDELRLQVPTAGLTARHDGQFSIDHVAIPTSASGSALGIRVASRLSDHDAYVLEVH